MPVIIDTVKCDGCQVCVDLCPTNALKVLDSVCQLTILLCIDCEACIDRCPPAAITLE